MNFEELFENLLHWKPEDSIANESIKDSVEPDRVLAGPPIWDTSAEIPNLDIRDLNILGEAPCSIPCPTDPMPLWARNAALATNFYKIDKNPSSKSSGLKSTSKKADEGESSKSDDLGGRIKTEPEDMSVSMQGMCLMSPDELKKSKEVDTDEVEEISMEEETRERALPLKRKRSLSAKRDTAEREDDAAVEEKRRRRKAPTKFEESLPVPGLEVDPANIQFSADELQPQPILKKSSKKYIPEQEKDDNYWVRRVKNNMAAKRSREARRAKENQIILRAAYLEKQNATMKEEVDTLKKENTSLKEKVKKLQMMLDGGNIAGNVG